MIFWWHHAISAKSVSNRCFGILPSNDLRSHWECLLQTYLIPVSPQGLYMTKDPFTFIKFPLNCFLPLFPSFLTIPCILWYFLNWNFPVNWQLNEQNEEWVLNLYQFFYFTAQKVSKPFLNPLSKDRSKF